jgi:hypothetical protein
MKKAGLSRQYSGSKQKEPKDCEEKRDPCERSGHQGSERKSVTQMPD